MSFRDILKTQRSIKKTGSVWLSNRHAFIVIILPSIGWEKLHDELRRCFISFWDFPAQFSLCSDQPSPIFVSLNTRTQSACWKPPGVLIITSSSRQFLRATVCSSCFHMANLQPFTLPCPVTEFNFWFNWLPVKNLATLFLDIYSMLQRCSPLAMLGLLGINEGGNLCSPLYERKKAPTVSDSHSTALVWLQCKLSTCFSSALTWLFPRVSKVQEQVKIVISAQAPDYSCLSCWSPPAAHLAVWLWFVFMAWRHALSRGPSRVPFADQLLICSLETDVCFMHLHLSIPYHCKLCPMASKTSSGTQLTSGSCFATFGRCLYLRRLWWVTEGSKAGDKITVLVAVGSIRKL